jgi:DNA-binding NarL/FixJ family response regulator
MRLMSDDQDRRREPRDRGPWTEREQQVLHGIFEGLANKEIGAKLGVSESAVKATLQQLFQKTGVRTRSQLVRVALESPFFDGAQEIDSTNSGVRQAAVRKIADA